jgi:cytolysin-activating lysine-acyltransferase
MGTVDGNSDSAIRSQSKSGTLGELIGMLLQVPARRSWRVAEIERHVVPAVHHGQLRVYCSGTRPVGYVSWALLSEEVARRYACGDYPLTAADWKSGDQPWIIDFVALDGRARAIASAFRDNSPFGGRTAKALRPARGGPLPRVAVYR